MTQPTTERGADLDTSAQPPKQEKASLLDDFMDIFYAPSSVFARRQHASFWIPFIIVSLLFGLVTFSNRDLFEGIMDAEFSRAMAKRAASGGPQLTEDQMQAARRFTASIGTVGAFFIAPIGIFFVGLVTWLVGKFVDAKETLGAALVVATFAYVPRVVEGILARVQGLLIDTSSFNSRYSFSLGVGRFLDPDTTSPILLALVGRIDVFTIWVTVLLAIGLAVTGKISRGKAAIAGVIIWLIGGLPTIAQALQ
jgi:hypothetical protein